MSATGTPPSSSAIAQTLLSALKTDVLVDANGLLMAFFKNVQANPTPQSVVAQGGILFASALLQGPSLEQQSIGQIAAAGQALLTSLVPAT